MKWKKTNVLVIAVLFFLVLISPIRSQIAEVIEDVVGYDVNLPDGKTAIYSSKFDSSKQLRIWTEKEEYTCLQTCTIPVHVINNRLLTEATQIDTDSIIGGLSKEEKIALPIEEKLALPLEPEIKEVKEDEKLKLIQKNETFETIYYYTFNVPTNTPKTKIDFVLNINGEQFILDPIISGCTETATEIFCTGALTGNTITTNKTIIISGANIDGTTGADITLTSSTGIIVNLSILNSSSGTGTNGNILLRIYNDTDATLKNGSILINNSITNSYGGAGTTGAGGSGSFSLNGASNVNISIYNLTMNNNGGMGGTAGNGVGQSGGGSTLQLLSKINKLYIFNSTIDSIAGTGGSGTGSGDAGGSAGTHNIDVLAAELIINKSTINLQGGTGGGASQNSGTMGGSSDSVLTVDNITFYNSTITMYGGNGGSGGSSSNNVGGQGGTTLFTITSTNLNVFGTIWNAYGATGGNGDCAAGHGGAVTITINSKNILIDDTSTLNWYGGTGGQRGVSCSGDQRDGGNGGATTINIYSDFFNYTSSTLSFNGGAGSQGGGFGSTDGNGGNSVLSLMTNRTQSSSSVLNTNGGSCSGGCSTGTSSSKIEASLIELLSSDTITSQYQASGYNILNFTGSTNKLTANGATIQYPYYTYCTQRLVIETGGTNILNLTHTNCTLNTLSNLTNFTLSPVQVGKDINGSFSVVDAEGDTPVANETDWYVNLTRIATARNQFTLGAGNFSNGANITLSGHVNDSFQFGNWFNSTPVLIGDTIAPVFISNSSASSTVVATPITLYVNVTDNGGVATVRAEIQDTNLLKINYSMSLTSGTFANGQWTYNYVPAIVGDYFVLFYATDGSGNQNRTFANLSFSATAVPAVVIVQQGGGGGGGEVPRTRNTTFNLLTENFNEEYFSVSAHSNSIEEVKIFIENTGNKTVTIKLSCIESSNSSSGKLCDSVSFDKSSYEIVPSNFPFEATMKVRFGLADVFDTYAVVIEGESQEGGYDDLRVSFIIFPQFKDILKIVKLTLVGYVELGDSQIPIPLAAFFLLFEGLMLIVIIKAQPEGMKFYIIGMTIIIYLVTSFMGLQLCKIGTCSTLGGI